MRWSVLAAYAAAYAALLFAQPAARLGEGAADLRAVFAHPPDDCRIMMRWWWFGPAVEKPELERELRAMKEGGIGGVEIQPVYPVTLDDPARGLVNLPYLSDGFLDAVRFANDKARELGLARRYYARQRLALWRTAYAGRSRFRKIAGGTAGPCRPTRKRCRCPKSAKAKSSSRRLSSAASGFDRITNIDDAGMHVSPAATAGGAF